MRLSFYLFLWTKYLGFLFYAFAAIYILHFILIRQKRMKKTSSWHCYFLSTCYFPWEVNLYVSFICTHYYLANLFDWLIFSYQDCWHFFWMRKNRVWRDIIRSMFKKKKTFWFKAFSSFVFTIWKRKCILIQIIDMSKIIFSRELLNGNNQFLTFFFLPKPESSLVA